MGRQGSVCRQGSQWCGRWAMPAARQMWWQPWGNGQAAKAVRRHRTNECSLLPEEECAAAQHTPVRVSQGSGYAPYMRVKYARQHPAPQQARRHAAYRWQAREMGCGTRGLRVHSVYVAPHAARSWRFSR